MPQWWCSLMLNSKMSPERTWDSSFSQFWRVNQGVSSMKFEGIFLASFFSFSLAFLAAFLSRTGELGCRAAEAMSISFFLSRERSECTERLPVDCVRRAADTTAAEAVCRLGEPSRWPPLFCEGRRHRRSVHSLGSWSSSFLRLARWGGSGSRGGVSPAWRMGSAWPPQLEREKLWISCDRRDTSCLSRDCAYRVLTCIMAAVFLADVQTCIGNAARTHGLSALVVPAYTTRLDEGRAQQWRSRLTVPARRYEGRRPVCCVLYCSSM